MSQMKSAIAAFGLAMALTWSLSAAEASSPTTSAASGIGQESKAIRQCARETLTI